MYLFDFYSCSHGQRRLILSNFQIYKIIFEYGPPQFHLLRYVAKKTIILWKEAKKKCILKDDGQPTHAFLFISGDNANAEDCFRMFGFGVYQHEELSELVSYYFRGNLKQLINVNCLETCIKK